MKQQNNKQATKQNNAMEQCNKTMLKQQNNAWDNAETMLKQENETIKWQKETRKQI